MSLTLPVIGERAPEKPRWGEACNGCGYCCVMETCAVARELMDAKEAPCPALEFDDGRFWCGLIRNPAKHLGLKVLWPGFVPLLKATIGIGTCCDTDDEV